MFKGFAIEFQASEWEGGSVGANPNASRDTYRVLVDNDGVRAFILTSEGFGGWNRVDGDQSSRRVGPGPTSMAKMPLSENRIIALALRGYHQWWMEMRCTHPGRPNWDACNGIEIVNIGTVKKES